MLEFAIDVARQAGALLRDAYAGGPAQVRSKRSRSDLVTEVDLASERLIVAAIRDRFPEHAIHAEESALGLPEGGPVWVADPLDGTTNFAHGVPLFCVSLAFIDDGRVELGVTYDPLREEMFWAQQGQGAWCNGRRLRASTAAALEDAVLATGFAYDLASSRDNNLPEFNALVTRVRGVRWFGSAALDLAWVAAGRLDGYWERNLEPWDFAAGQLLVHEAGGSATTYQGAPWRPGERNMIASNGVPALHEALLTTIGTARNSQSPAA